MSAERRRRFDCLVSEHVVAPAHPRVVGHRVRTGEADRPVGRTNVIPVIDDFTSDAPDSIGINLVDAREHFSQGQVTAEADKLPADLFARGVGAFGAG